MKTVRTLKELKKEPLGELAIGLDDNYVSERRKIDPVLDYIGWTQQGWRRCNLVVRTLQSEPNVVNLAFCPEGGLWGVSGRKATRASCRRRAPKQVARLCRGASAKRRSAP